ncbi:MAG TPA: glycosyltransferase [Spirillospora sp.]|nr:glycosyltransferase [Spirillospora sp.]
MHVLVIARLGQQKIYDKLMPLILAQQVTRVTLVRHAPVEIETAKLTQVIHNSGLDPQGLNQSVLLSLRNMLACLANGWRLARQQKPDLVLAYNLVPYGIIALLVGVLTNRKTAVSLIGTDYNRRVRHPLLGPLLSRLLRHFSLVAVFGDTPRQQLVDSGLRPEQVIVLPNATDTSRYQPAVEPAQATTDLIYTGYLRPGKRVDLLLYTLREIHNTRPQTTLTIVGEGTERENLITLTRQLDIESHVRFTGWADDVQPYLRQARMLGLFSEHEGLPMSVIEALCTGLPVIVTAVGALETLVQHGENGFLLPEPADPSTAAGYILSVLDDLPRYTAMREAALATCGAYGYDRAAQVWDDVCDRLF